jgi:hypothetical protein
VDSGFDEPTGYYYEAVVLNAFVGTTNDPVDRRSLWFMIGNRIRVSDLKDYTLVIKEIDAGSGGSIYSPAFHINSADLIGALLLPTPTEEEQAEKKKAPPNTQLSRLRGLANSVKIAAARAARTAAATREAPPAAQGSEEDESDDDK